VGVGIKCTTGATFLGLGCILKKISPFGASLSVNSSEGAGIHKFSILSVKDSEEFIFAGLDSVHFFEVLVVGLSGRRALRCDNQNPNRFRFPAQKIASSITSDSPKH